MKYDAASDTWEIEGLKFSGRLLRFWSGREQQRTDEPPLPMMAEIRSVEPDGTVWIKPHACRVP